MLQQGESTYQEEVIPVGLSFLLDSSVIRHLVFPSRAGMMSAGFLPISSLHPIDF